MNPDAPTPPLTFNLADLFESVVVEVPEAVAIIAGPRRLTFAELNDRSNQLANVLTARGVGAGDFVGLLLTNGTEYIEGMLACFKLAAVPVNVNYRYVDAELRHLFSDAGLVALIYDASFSKSVATAIDSMTDRRAVLAVNPTSDDSAVDGSEDYESAVNSASITGVIGDRSGDDVYCVYTGGTTGLPKGVLWRHEDIFFAAMGGGDSMRMGDVIAAPEDLATRVLRPGLVALAAPPLMHASAHWLAFSTLFGGGTVVLMPGGHLDRSEMVAALEAERVNILVIVGDAMAGPFLDELDARRAAGTTPDMSSLLAVGSGGAILSPTMKQRLASQLPNAMIVDVFGSSETGQVGGSQAAGDPFGAPRLQASERTTVLDEDDHPVAAGSGIVGRLAHGGRVPLGYHGDPVKTAATFITVEGKRWSIPGDLATIDADGDILVLGRDSQCINTGGEKVFPEEVEGALKAHPDVVDVVVVGAPDDQWGEHVTAVVQPRPGSAPTLESLRESVRGTLAAYKLPRQLVLVDVVERSPSGKADYRWAKRQLPSTADN